MKGKLSRMWRSGLSMMLALIMVFSLGTVAFAAEGSAADAIALADSIDKASAAVSKAWNAVQATGNKLEIIANSDETNVFVAALAKLSLKLGEAVVSQDGVQELKDETLSLKADIDALIDEMDAVQAELDAAQADVDAAKAKAEGVQAQAKELQNELDNTTITIVTDIDLDIDVDLDFDLTTMTPDEIQAKADEIKAQVEKLDNLKELKAELEAKAAEEKAEADRLLAKVNALQAEADALEADVNAAQDRLEAVEDKAEALEADASDMTARATTLAKDYVAYAAGTAGNVAEDLTDVAKNLAAYLLEQADQHNAKAVAEYVYGSFKAQGYVTLAVKTLEQGLDCLREAKAEVAKTAHAFSPELKAELVASLDAAEAAVADLVNEVKSTDNVNSDAVKHLAGVAKEKLAIAKNCADKIGTAGTLEDAKLIKDLVVKACTTALSGAEKLVDLLVAAIYDATHETIAVPCNGDYNVAYVGDASAETYAADIAANLGGKLSDVADADMILMGYSAYSMTNFVVEQLRSGKELNWSAVSDVVADTNYVETATKAIADKLAAAGVSDELVDPIIVALSSYAYAYAKYIVEYPLEVAELNDDALVVVVGQYNPLKGVSLKAGDVTIDMGLCLEALVEASGLYNLVSAMMMPNCIYVDVTDANVATKMAPVTATVEEMLAVVLNAAGMLPATGDEIEKAVMDALDVVYAGHVAEAVAEVPAWCDAPGCTAGVKCSVCGIVLEGCEEIPALGHDWDGGVVTPADSYLATMIIFTCQRCDAIRTEAYNKFHEHFFDGDDKNNDGVTDFRPEGDITRAEVAVVFYRLLNDKYTIHKVGDAYEAKGTFSDVATGDWFAMQVEVLADLGLIAGYPDGTFRPWEPITRAEFATMGVALAQFAYDGTEDFPDVAESDWFYDFVRTAVNNGLVVGDDKNNDGVLEFRPEDNITRAEASVVASNMAGRPYDTIVEYFDFYMDGGVIPVDVELNVNREVTAVNEWAEIREMHDIVGHWAYYWMLGASNDHYHEVGLTK